jgi:hypothetical protein
VAPALLASLSDAVLKNASSGSVEDSRRGTTLMSKRHDIT